MTKFIVTADIHGSYNSWLTIKKESIIELKTGNKLMTMDF